MSNKIYLGVSVGSVLGLITFAILYAKEKISHKKDIRAFEDMTKETKEMLEGMLKREIPVKGEAMKMFANSDQEVKNGK